MFLGQRMVKNTFTPHLIISSSPARQENGGPSLSGRVTAAGDTEGGPCAGRQRPTPFPDLRESVRTIRRPSRV